MKGIDLSERDYGVSLLNDCKYGHDVIGHTMRLTLIKAATNPDALADIGEHSFTYSLLPHAGDWFAGGTQQQAQRLNAPVLALDVNGSLADQAAAGQALPSSLSFLVCESNHVVIDAIKKAEDSDDWIVRCYEFGGKRGEVRFRSHLAMTGVEEVNLMEQDAQPVAGSANEFAAYFTPYELKTFRIGLHLPV